MGRISREVNLIFPWRVRVRREAVERSGAGELCPVVDRFGGSDCSRWRGRAESRGAGSTWRVVAAVAWILDGDFGARAARGAVAEESPWDIRTPPWRRSSCIPAGAR